MPLELDYYYGNEAEQYNFYRIPKTLLTDHHYKSVSLEAKVLYGLMLDRMGLSVRNGWLDSPPYTPEMNPIEHIWKELRAGGFHNEVFQTLEKVVDRLCDIICDLSAETIRSITTRC